jgi:hypothetical protein
MTRALLSIIAFLMTIGLARADTEARIEVYEFGTYSSADSVDIGLTRRGLDYGLVDRIELVQSTRTVVGHVGNSFGFRFRVGGRPLGAPIHLTLVMRFPPPGMVTKSGSAPFLDDDYRSIKVIGSDHFEIWTFEDKAQIVPGVWTFEIWNGNKKLAEEKFTVILPPIA